MGNLLFLGKSVGRLEKKHSGLGQHKNLKNCEQLEAHLGSGLGNLAK